MKDEIVKSHYYNHRIHDVWNAISRAEEISAWFIQADFKAEVGYLYTFTHQNTRITGEVLEVNPVTDLVYTWKVSGTEVNTIVRWTLEEKNDGTMLTIRHSGISQYPGESALKMFEAFSGGWQNCIAELEKFLKEPSHVHQD